MTKQKRKLRKFVDRGRKRSYKFQRDLPGIFKMPCEFLFCEQWYFCDAHTGLSPKERKIGLQEGAVQHEKKMAFLSSQFST